MPFTPSSKPFLIAEIGQAHDGSFGILVSLVDQLISLGVDAIKFQVHYADHESSEQEPFRVPFSFVDTSRYEYWKRMELNFEQWSFLYDRCHSSNVEFLATPFSVYAFNLLEKIGVSRYKVGSGDISNYLLIDKILSTRKHILLSSGISCIRDIESTVNYIKSRYHDLTVLHCTSMYPTPPDAVGLKWIPFLREHLQVDVGFSDHSGSIYPALAASLLGASCIEFHTTFDKSMFGPDSSSSLSINDVRELVSALSLLSQCNTYGQKSITDVGSTSYMHTMNQMFGRSLATTHDLGIGHIITVEDLECKKPAGMGIPSSSYHTIIGRSLVNPLPAGSFISSKDIA